MKWGICTWIFGREPIERTLARVARCGYSGVELIGAPETTDHDKLKALLTEYHLEVSSIGGAFPLEKDLSSVDEEIRRAGIDYAKACVDMAVLYGAPLVVVLPSAVGKQRPSVSWEQDWKVSRDAIIEIGEYAQERKIKIALEALNRFETFLINRAEQLLEMVTQVALENVGMLLDTFHMNIEERSLPDAFRLAGKKLFHVHVADSNRQPPGRGHTDFSSVIHVLKEIRYQGYINAEFLPTANPYEAIEMEPDETKNELFTKETISYLKSLLD